MATPDYVGYIYAIAVAAGGIIGYAKRGSVPSLVAGLSFGAAIAYSAHKIQTTGDHSLMMVTSGGLAGFMAYRFSNTGKVMPAGLVCAISLLILGRSLAKKYII